MVTLSKKNISLNVCMLTVFYSYIVHTSVPKLTLIFVIDQLSYNYLPIIKPYVNDGFKKLLTEGVSFTNAQHPHGMPATCTGHTALSTGAYGSEHGIVGNSWYSEDGTIIACDAADAKDAAVLAPDGLYDYGRSPHHIMVDGISDQFMLTGTEEEPHHAYAISLKSRAAIATANRVGIALWFDNKSGQFTSSKAYVTALPSWVTDFNKTSAIISPSEVYWKQKYPDSSKAYATLPNIDYRYVKFKKSLINSSILIGSEINKNNPYSLFEHTPQANKLVADCSIACIDALVDTSKPDRLLLWVCISSVDKLGHKYGPWSKEVLDMLYHLDTQIGDVLRQAENAVGAENILTVLTSDHGIAPIVEQLHDHGVNLGTRINVHTLVKELNNYVETKYGYENLIYGVKGHRLYIDTKKLIAVPKEERTAIIKELQQVLEAQEGIKKAWTHEELQMRSFPPYSAEYYFKQQLFGTRSGTLILQVYPYTLIGTHKYGTCHRTPYTHNTHVPLILYQPGVIERKKIHTKVTTLQLAPTLAEILEIPQPSAAMEEVLPEILPPK